MTKGTRVGMDTYANGYLTGTVVEVFTHPAPRPAESATYAEVRWDNGWEGEVSETHFAVLSA